MRDAFEALVFAALMVGLLMLSLAAPASWNP